MTDLVVMAAREKAKAAKRRLRTAPHGTVRSREQKFIRAQAELLRAELEVSTPERRQ